MSAKAGVLPLKTIPNVGTVTSVSGVNANGFTVSVANPTSTPSITVGTSLTGLLKGTGTAMQVATSGTDYAPATSGTSILYGNGAGGFSNVTIGSGLTFTTGTLASSGGTGTVTHTVGALTANQLVIGNGGADVQTLGSLGTTTTVLHGNAAGAPTYGAVSLTADVSGILPGANGGTGVANTGKTITIGGNLTTSGAFASTFTMTNTTAVTFPTSGTLLSTAAAVTVAQGGTGLATLTANNVILGNGASNPTFVAPGTSGNVLTSNGTTWTSAASAGAAFSTITTTTISGTPTTLTYTSITNEDLLISFDSLVVGGGAATLQLQVSTDNGSTFGTATVIAGAGTISGTASFTMLYMTGVKAGFLTCLGMNSTTTGTLGTSLIGGASGGINSKWFFVNAQVNAIRFSLDSGGSFNTGTVVVKGRG